MNILIAEDNEFYSQLLEFSFLRMNHSVIIVSTVEEGLKASETNLDIAIIDYFLDDGEALPIIDNLLRNNKECRLIVHTGSSSLELRKKLKFRGVRQIISKKSDAIAEIEAITKSENAKSAPSKLSFKDKLKAFFNNFRSKNQEIST
jgi:ActR/RegA family two-component response regulator